MHLLDDAHCLALMTSLTVINPWRKDKMGGNSHCAAERNAMPSLMHQIKIILATLRQICHFYCTKFTPCLCFILLASAHSRYFIGVSTQDASRHWQKDIGRILVTSHLPSPLEHSSWLNQAVVMGSIDLLQANRAYSGFLRNHASHLQPLPDGYWTELFSSY